MSGTQIIVIVMAVLRRLKYLLNDNSASYADMMPFIVSLLMVNMSIVVPPQLSLFVGYCATNKKRACLQPHGMAEARGLPKTGTLSDE